MLDHMDNSSDKEFYQHMCSEQTNFQEMKRFVAKKQLEKLQIMIVKKQDDIYQRLSDSTDITDIQDNDFIELGKLKALYSILELLRLSNLEECIDTIDACNIILNGEENCDIIIKKATEEELHLYIYNKMKQFEKNTSIDTDYRVKK